MKPVVVLGKGSAAQYVPLSDNYDIACIAEAVRLTDGCQWLALNDMPAFNEMKSVDFHKAERLILPTFLHVDTRAKAVVKWDKINNLIPIKDIRLYQLPTAREKVGDLPSFGVCWSTTESLVCYLLLEGYRRFVLCGVGNGNIDYHPAFKPRGGPKNKNHFRTNYSRVVRRIIGSKGTVETYGRFVSESDASG